MRLEYFDMIDRVVTFDPSQKRIVTRSTVPGESPVFEGHFPGHPLVPGVLLYRVLFSIINIKQLTAGALMLSIQTGVEAVLIIISIAVGVAIPNLFARHYIDRQKRRRMEKIFAGNTPPNE